MIRERLLYLAMLLASIAGIVRVHNVDANRDIVKTISRIYDTKKAQLSFFLVLKLSKR